MAGSQLNIPKKIKVGYQERGGTYTGRLAYIIYYDQKGKLRKERSWNGWRDNKIDPDEFDNEPTDGFVLNKKAGDYSSRWGGRIAYSRVYDPRGFEFEITVDNLLFILQECDCIKGKGLVGEFVYAWEGTSLVLLPASRPEYKESLEFTNLQTKKVTKKDMREGCLYQAKDTTTYMYLGRHEWYDYTSKYTGYGTQYPLKPEKWHIFVNIKTGEYWTQKGFTKLAVKLDDEPSADYARQFDKFKNKFPNSSKFRELVVEKFDNRKFEWDIWGRIKPCVLFSKRGEEYYPVRIHEVDRGDKSRVYVTPSQEPLKKFKDVNITVPRPPYYYSYGYSRRTGPNSLIKNVGELKLYRLFIKTENEQLVEI